MSLQQYEIEELIYRHIKNDLTDEEHQALEDWLAVSDENRKLFNELINEKTWEPELEDFKFYDSRKHHAKKKLSEMLLIAAPLVPVKKLWIKWVAAASIVGVVATGSVYLLMQQGKKKEVAKVTPAPVVNDVPPGGDKAILTLADGSTVVLDNAQNGVISMQGNAEVVKKDGEVVYDVKGRPGEVVYNTLATPRGGQYTIKLPDGSKAWLNAASSIKYPVMFAGGTRKVEVTGEVYFEVEKNEKMPFKVSVAQGAGAHKAEVQVLGTHFNINAYKDEPIVRTTLLEGKVRFVSGQDGKSATLKPGEQAQLNNNGSIAVEKAMVDEVMAWKNGKFRFSNADLKTIMRQISRWYDVEVRFEAPVNPTYSFILYRNMPVSKIIAVLHDSGGAHFKIEGNVIRVLP